MTTTSLKARCTSCRLLLLILRLTCVREHILVRTHSKFALGVAFHCSAAPSPPLFTSVSKMHDMRIVHTLRCTHNAHSLDPARPHKHGILINVCRIDVLSLSLSLSLSLLPLSPLYLTSPSPPLPPPSLPLLPPSLPPSLSCLLLQIHAPPVMAAYEYLHAAPVFFTSLSRTSLVSAQKGLCIAHVQIAPPRLL